MSWANELFLADFQELEEVKPNDVLMPRADELFLVADFKAQEGRVFLWQSETRKFHFPSFVYRFYCSFVICYIKRLNWYELNWNWNYFQATIIKTTKKIYPSFDGDITECKETVKTVYKNPVEVEKKRKKL